MIETEAIETRQVSDIMAHCSHIDDAVLGKDGRLYVSLGHVTGDMCPEELRRLKAGFIERGILWLQGSVARHFYELYLEQAAQHKERPEVKYRNELADTLKFNGWQVAKEQYTSQGRIDILAQNDSDIWIVEVKMKADSNSAAHALGQLLFYEKFYPGATLWFASPEEPDLTILSILDSYGVKYYERYN